MAVQRWIYDVAIHQDGAVIEHRVTVTAGDRLRAELEAAKHKIPATAIQNTTAVILWCALLRLGIVNVDWMTFQHQLLDEFDVVKGEDGKPLMAPPDPTRPAGSSTSPSPSPLTSAGAPTTGSVLPPQTTGY